MFLLFLHKLKYSIVEALEGEYMYFGSVFYWGSVVLVLAVTAALWLILRRTNVKIQSITILCLMAVNVLQHFLKFYYIRNTVAWALPSIAQLIMCAPA